MSAKQESLAYRASIAQRLQRSAVKEQYQKKEEQLASRLKKISADVRILRTHEAQASTRLFSFLASPRWQH